eukprot:maker-scaffold_72-snap-gene-0.55-mRNA-1 protein AED:0.04 eAED:0.04 QI:140/1/1/1/0.66/0.5/4/365/274
MGNGLPKGIDRLKSLSDLALVSVESKRKKAIQNINNNKRALVKQLQANENAEARESAEMIAKLDWEVSVFDAVKKSLMRLRNNVPRLKDNQTVPYELEEHVTLVVYFQRNRPINELKAVVRLLRKKYGVEYMEMCAKDELKKVDPEFVRRLRSEPPAGKTVFMYMQNAATTYQVPWTPDPATVAMGKLDDPIGVAGFSGGTASGLGDYVVKPAGEVPKKFVPAEINEKTKKDDDDKPPSGGTPAAAPKLPPVPKEPKVKGVNDLEAQLERLKNM